jgi:hypothetical protein
LPCPDLGLGQTGGMAMVSPDSCIPLLVDIGRSGGATGQRLVWRFTEPMLAISSAIIGGESAWRRG